MRIYLGTDLTFRTQQRIEMSRRKRSNLVVFGASQCYRYNNIWGKYMDFVTTLIRALRLKLGQNLLKSCGGVFWNSNGCEICMFLLCCGVARVIFNNCPTRLFNRDKILCVNLGYNHPFSFQFHPNPFVVLQ